MVTFVGTTYGDLLTATNRLEALFGIRINAIQANTANMASLETAREKLVRISVIIRDIMIAITERLNEQKESVDRVRKVENDWNGVNNKFNGKLGGL